MLVCHATKKLLDRARPAPLANPATASTTLPVSWYGTVLNEELAALVEQARP
ncbi:MAG: hypothetical protein ACRDZQ_13010 [Acidimicrobiales bacterium]